MMTNIYFDQVRDDDAHNLRSLYESDDCDNIDSPFSQCNMKCEYHEQDQFHNLISDLNYSKSYFHINCRGLSSNWEKFNELLGDLRQ